MIYKPFTAFALLLLIGACATAGDPEKTGIAAFEGDPRLGAKQSAVCYGSTIDGFRDTRRNSVIIEGRARREYLLTTRGCFKLEDALQLGVDSRGGCLSGGSKIIVSDAIMPARDLNFSDIDTCFVTGIYEWNENAGKPEVEPEK